MSKFTFVEFRETRLTSIITVVTTILQMSLYIWADKNPIGIAIINMTQLGAVTTLVFSSLYPAVKGFIFHRGEYLMRWKHGLRQENLPMALKEDYGSLSSPTGSSIEFQF